jgi:hypothetical protein
VSLGTTAVLLSGTALAVPGFQNVDALVERLRKDSPSSASRAREAPKRSRSTLSLAFSR